MSVKIRGGLSLLPQMVTGIYFDGVCMTYCFVCQSPELTVSIMKKSLSHLPENKRRELEKIAQTIRASASDVEMIILFGSYARGDWKEAADLEPGRKSGHVSDYDILAVTRDKSTALDIALWNKIACKISRKRQSAHCRIIVHDIQDINVKLAEGQYFYSDIKKDGYALYDTDNFRLATRRRLKPEEKKRIAQDHFDHWFERSENFYFLYQTACRKKMYKEAAFNLHQASEASYKAILLVFTNYNPNEHFLELLGSMAVKHDKALKNIFPRKTGREQKLFELLDYAYIGARYDASYMITKEELESLSARVKRLLTITEKICKARIR
jgi:uncharacterized protein